MIYWHIQMNQPLGRNKIKISSIEMLKESQPVIGTGDWEDIQCDYFKGSHKNGLKIGDIILVHEGETPIALCSIDSDIFTDNELQSKYKNKIYRKVKVLDFYKGYNKFKDSQGTLKRLLNSNKESWKFIDNWYKKTSNTMNYNNLIKLLKQKKQIILQGPPGTGKTRLAKILASALCNINDVKGITREQVSLSNANITEQLKNVDSIPSSSNRKTYRIENIKSDRCTVILETNSSYDIPFDGIRDAYKNRLWEGGQSNGYDPYNAAIAKYLYENNTAIKSVNTKDSADYALIQFHPSYTYEDFVRGIVVKNNGNEVEYRTENKILASLAAKANANYNDSKKDTKSITKEQWVKDEFEDFKDFIIDSMDSDSNYLLNDTVNIIGVEDDAFRYTGNTWKNQFRMKYSDIMYLYLNNFISRQSIKKQNKISPLARTHATYFKLLLDAFYDFMKGKKPPISNDQSIKQKNYVLIIDEINRANLPNVLGELIFALEYRGDSVESMYDIDGLNSIIIPPNLYIIGTMNTADRSVGHIDYAIRRRFAFVEVLPKILEDSELENKIFLKDKFIAVSKMFTSNIDDYILDSTVFLEKSEYLSDEFRVEDIWLGHSYFIAEDEVDFKMKMEYEIKPILKEYVKDGILSESSLEIINNL